MSRFRERIRSRAQKARKLVAKRAPNKKRVKPSALAPQARRLAGPLALRELCLVRAPAVPIHPCAMGQQIQVATYNVHRWTGLNGRSDPDPARACFVISELDAHVIALQEVLRPLKGEDPLERLADVLGLHLAFAATRMHRHGELGNAILSRWPILNVSTLDLSFSRLERRIAVAARFEANQASLGVVATHLALVDRTRHRQVRELLEHPQLLAGPAILLGDMNAWRRCKATRALEVAMRGHPELDWPPSFPAAAPVLALDRVYARGARVVEVRAHATAAARRASDHLPVLAQVELPAA
ncbi:MAG TPA: endonuclease [Deltaproteobacteria bacterium]|jgi:endonuclease/exonuclease/phosphatase family metal-dependent hydrolase|nr:endonuclease [Deltaproteobacteria bacterium]